MYLLNMNNIFHNFLSQVDYEKCISMHISIIINVSNECLHVFTLHTNVWLFIGIATSSVFYKPYEYSIIDIMSSHIKTCLSDNLVTSCWEKGCWYLINILT